MKFYVIFADSNPQNVVKFVTSEIEADAYVQNNPGTEYREARISAYTLVNASVVLLS